MSVRRSLAWTFSAQFTIFLLQFCGAVIVARLLSPHELGVYALGVATAGLITVMTTFGISAYLIREVELSDAQCATAFTINAIINVALALAIFGISFIFPYNAGDDNVGWILRLLSIPPLIGIVEFLPSTLVQRGMQFQAKSIVSVSAALLGNTTTILLASKGYGASSMAYAAIVASSFRSLLLCAFLPQHVSFKLSLKGWSKILIFGVRMLTVSGVSQLGQRASEITLGMTLGLTDLGIYSRASGLSSLIFSNIYGTATNVVFAQLSKVFRETGLLRDTFLRGLQIILAFMWPLLAGLAVLSRPAINIIYGPKWLDAAVPLSLLMISQIIVLSFGMNWELFVLRDETAKQAKYETIRSVVGLVFFAGGSVVSLGVATLGRTLEAIVGAGIYLPKMTSLSGATSRELRRIYIESAGLTGGAVIPSIIIMTLYDWSPETPLLMMALGIAIGIFLWLSTLIFLRHPLFDELLHLLSISPLGHRLRNILRRWIPD